MTGCDACLGGSEKMCLRHLRGLVESWHVQTDMLEMSLIISTMSCPAQGIAAKGCLVLVDRSVTSL